MFVKATFVATPDTGVDIWFAIPWFAVVAPVVTTLAAATPVANPPVVIVRLIVA